MSHPVRFSVTKYSNFQALLIIFMAFALMAGKCSQGKCDEYAIISDQSGLDGCGLLFQLKDNSLLLPVNLGEYDLELSEGDTISISYKVIPDAMSICMRESASVTLTCIDVVSKK